MSDSPSASRRGRFRFLYQFSLRTLLLATAGVAVFCNWCFQPKYHEEVLAGKELRLRRQIKLANPADEPKVPTGYSSLSPSYDPNILNHGKWSLLDGDSLTLTRGRFHENRATGNWTAWYPTGGKAAEGRKQQGVKVGRWRTWYEDETLASDITFADRPVIREEPYESYGAQLLDESPASDRIGVAHHVAYFSSREGSAKAWHPNGKLKYEGGFSNNRQEGVWTYYNEQGRVTERGPFRAGLRHGEWTCIPTRSVSEGAPSKTQTIRYIHGRTKSELNEILARLKPLLARDDRAQRYAALIDLAELGEGGAPLLRERLAHGDEHEQQAIIGIIPRMPTGVQVLLPQVCGLAASKNPRIAHQARLTLFQIDSACRAEYFEPLLAEAQAAPVLGLCLEEMTVLYRYGELRRGQVFAALMALSTKRDDADESEVAASAAELGGDVTPYLLAACEHEQALVRLQAARTLERLIEPWSRPPSLLWLGEADRQGLVARLKKDPSADVRQAAEDMERLPPNSGFGAGFF